MSVRSLWLSCALAALGALFGLSQARAQDANQYGAHGRTVISGGLHASRTNVKTPDAYGHEHAASAGGSLNIVHFWWRNVALGGTVVAGTSAAWFERGFHGSNVWYGGDLDGIVHLPLTKRLSFRFWLWAGLRGSRTPARYLAIDPQGVGYVAEYRKKTLAFRPGVSVDFLVHLSPSVAFTLGPSFNMRVPLQGGGELDYTLSGGPSMTYSFGPNEAEGSSHSQLEDARLFGARGRTALAAWTTLTVGDEPSGVESYVDIAFARFVTQGLGLGAYVLSDLHDWTRGGRNYVAGAGFQMMGDLPLGRSLSLLVVPQLGYMWKQTERQESYGPSDPPRERSHVAHEVPGSLPAYVAVHLHDGLVVGVGPELIAHVRVGEIGGASPNDRFLSAGVSSLITASY